MLMLQSCSAGSSSRSSSTGIGAKTSSSGSSVSISSERSSVTAKARAWSWASVASRSAGSLSVPSRAARTRSARVSVARSSARITAGSACQLPSRSLSSAASKSCANWPRMSKLKVPALPLIECTARKAALTVSGSGTPRSSACRQDSSSARSSSHSWKNTTLIPSSTSAGRWLAAVRRGAISRRPGGSRPPAGPDRTA